MHGISKTLDEMTLVERSSLLEAVVNALEATAEEAREEGDVAFVANSMCVASTIRGLDTGWESHDVAAAQILLEQGITMIHQFSTRGVVTTLH